MPVIHLRSATQTDLQFAFDVMTSAMRGHVEQTWGPWEPQQQFEIHAKSFKPETHSVVLVDDTPAGILAVEEHAGHLQLEKMFLLPGFRNRGVGTELLRQVLQRAHAAGKPVRLRVLASNSSAQCFYARCGFVVASTTKERVFMETGPALASHSSDAP